MGCCASGQESHKNQGNNEQSQIQGKQTSWMFSILLVILVGILLLIVFG